MSQKRGRASASDNPSATKASASESATPIHAEPLLVVRAYVQNDRQGFGGRNAANQRVERQLADRYAQPAYSLVPDSENAFSIGDHNHTHFLIGTVAQQTLDLVSRRIGDDQATRTAVNVAELLAGLCHHRSVHNGQHLLDVI